MLSQSKVLNRNLGKICFNLILCRPAQDSVTDVVVTGGEQKSVSLKSAEVLCVETFKWKSFPDLTYPLESHVQTDQSQPVVLGGMQTGNASTEVLRYANKEWKRAAFFE